MFIFAAILVVGVLALVIRYWGRFSESEDDYPRQWFLRWARRGVLAPILVWALLNVGTMPYMPPLTTAIAHQRAAGQFAAALAPQTAIAAMVIISCWAAVTFGWFLAGLLQHARNNEDFILAALIWSPVAIPIFWIILAQAGWAAFGFAALLWLWPLAGYCLSIADLRKTAPAYSRAIGKMKFGKYAEAEIAIVSELEKCETDFDGWMMLAELYAHQFHDLAEAEKTVCELCDDPATTLSQVSIALHRLADWQLKLRHDPLAARRVLEEICARMPGTHLASMARFRINQIPASVADYNEQQQQQARPVPMPALSEDFDAGQSAKMISPQEAAAAANQLVEKLTANPDDTPAREKLARLFAEQLGQFDLAVGQLELLVDMPGQSPQKSAEWLGLVAAWRMKQPGEGEAVRQTLERLIHDFPQSPQAFAAQRRLGLMNQAAKALKPAPKSEKPRVETRMAGQSDDIAEPKTRKWLPKIE